MILAIVGPTASGKTALAIRVAERLGAEIISCDSVQVYRGLDIGTAKPTPAERARVPHHLIDVAWPDEEFSAARFVELADAVIADLSAREKSVVIVGGTGLYLRAHRFGLVDAPSRDEPLRARLYAEEATARGVLHARLREVDPVSASRIAPADLVRVVRALEIHALTGVPLSRHHAEHDRAARHAMRVLVLDPPLDLLTPRIAARVDVMLSGGLVEETRALVARYGPGLRELGAVGYREVVAHLAGQLPFMRLAQTITHATRRYARRQRTWFRKEPGAEHFASAEALLGEVLGG